MEKCNSCKKLISEKAEIIENDKVIKICYECAALIEKQWMREKGHTVLYLTYDRKTKKYEVTNFPGTLKIPVVNHWKGNHNFLGPKSVTYFRFMFDDEVWAGKQLGEFNQLAYCKRTKIKDIHS